MYNSFYARGMHRTQSIAHLVTQSFPRNPKKTPLLSPRPRLLLPATPPVPREMRAELDDGTQLEASVHPPMLLRVRLTTARGNESVTEVDLKESLGLHSDVTFDEALLELSLFELSRTGYVIACTRNMHAYAIRRHIPAIPSQYIDLPAERTACFYINVNSTTGPLLFTFHELKLRRYWEYGGWIRNIASFDNDEYIIFHVYDPMTMRHVLDCCRRVGNAHAWTAEFLSPTHDQKKINLAVPDYMDTPDHIVVVVEWPIGFRLGQPGWVKDESSIIARADGLEFAGELPPDCLWFTPKCGGRRHGLSPVLRVKCAVPQ